MTRAEPSLELGLIGNGKIAALIDSHAEVVWCCVPRFDGDPVFCSLLSGDAPSNRTGSFAITLDGASWFEQSYIEDTPILVTRITNDRGDEIEITDFCPRTEQNGKLYAPIILVREVRLVSGSPSIRVNLNLASDYGCKLRDGRIVDDSIEFAGDPPLTLRTNASVDAIQKNQQLDVVDKIWFVFGAALSVREADVESLLDESIRYWEEWTAALKLPEQFAEAVTRAAITLELNAYHETGGIVASLTTSIPEAPNTGRNWDYRYCWPRDAYFVVNALGRLGDVRTSARYLHFLIRVARANDRFELLPMYALDGRGIPEERREACLPGYRGMGPVHVGNKASIQAQNDIYGEAILTAEPLFRVRRGHEVGEDLMSARAGDRPLFEDLEKFGEHASRLYDVPDAGLWELRGSQRVHTFSSIMCWAACDRLATYAAAVKRPDRARYWTERATEMHRVISRRSWNERKKAFTAAMDGDSLDASLLLIPRLRFLDATDQRFIQTVDAIERELKHGDFIYRYVEQDDFGHPENAFLVCTFWYIEALAAIGGDRRNEALSLYNRVLAARNKHGLLAEDLDTRTLEQWGNFPQTYCMAGIIDCALTLSRTDHGIDSKDADS